MSRYLTPSKIGLLALISLYTDSVVPSTATIPILSFLVSHLLPVESSNSKDNQSTPIRSFVISIDHFQKATITHASGIPGRTVWDLFLKKLWEINSFDAFHSFFDNLSLLLEKTRGELLKTSEAGRSADPKRIILSRGSPLGAFIRRAQLEFTRLQFHDGIVLWKSFITYRGPTLALWKRRNPAAGRLSFDSNLQEEHHGLSSRLTALVYSDVVDETRTEASVSVDDMEKLLEFQFDQMQKMGNRLPQVMSIQFRSMIKTGVSVPYLSHYVGFLDSWKAGDYSSSFDNLHRYFDYTMLNRDRTFYQYALLNLAILHADFGCYTEAISAMQETITTARENNDMVCLNYSLSWLYHFRKAHPKEMAKVQEKGILGSDKEALAFLKAKSKENNMWSLLSTSLLSEAKLALSSGDNISNVFEYIIKASHLNVTKYVDNAVGSQIMLQSAVFGRLGVSCQAWLYGEIFLQCYSSQSPAEDMMHFICRNAYSLALKGRYEDAFSRLEQTDQETLRTLRHHQQWTAYSALLKLQRQLHRHNLVAAEEILAQLQAIPFLSQDLLFSIAIFEIDLRMRRQDYSEAMSNLEKLATKLSDEEADVFQRVKVMTLKAKIYDKGGIPQKGFSVSLRAASLAYQYKLLPALWEAVGAVCQVLISTQEFDAATKLLESILPQVLECEDSYLAGQTFSILADGHMGMAGQANAETLQRKEQLAKALECIDWAFDELSRVEDVKGQCEMMAKKATIMHLNGDPVLANDCAAKYLDLKKAAKEQV